MTTVHDLDKRLTAVETRWDNLATKTDLAQLETRLTRWMVAMLIGSTVAASSIATLIQVLID